MLSLSRLWGRQGRKREAHHLLREIYSWFTEGFDTPDVQEARGLLKLFAPTRRLWASVWPHQRWSAASLFMAIGGWQLNPVNVADGHRSSASHWSIMVQASSLAFSH